MEPKPSPVFMMPEEWSIPQKANALAEYTMKGNVVEGCYLEDYETWFKRGRPEDCDCQLLQCVCLEARQHVKECIYRRVITSWVGIACDDHQEEDCRDCTPCTCPPQE